MKTEIIGGGERSEFAARYLLNKKADGDICTVTILPIPSTRDGVFVTGCDLMLDELPERLEKSTLLAGYGLPDRLCKALSARGISYYDARGDEKFILENAELTALGALSYLLSEFKEAPCDLKIGVIGYGRIGRVLTRILLFLGASVRVFSSRSENIVALGGLGVDCYNVQREFFSYDSISSLDVLLNTAPTDLSYIFPEKNVGGLRVLDLAISDCFPGISGVEYLPSLPARMFPESAGAAYGRAIERHLSSDGGGVL